MAKGSEGSLEVGGEELLKLNRRAVEGEGSLELNRRAQVTARWIGELRQWRVGFGGESEQKRENQVP